MKKFVWISLICLGVFALAIFYGYKSTTSNVSLRTKVSTEEIEISQDIKKEEPKPQEDEFKITKENYKEKVINRIFEYMDESKKRSYGIYPFSEQIGNELKWGFKDKSGDILITPQYERVYTDWAIGIFGVSNGDGYQFLNLSTNTISENLYEDLIFNSEDMEIGMLSDGDNEKILLINKNTGDRKTFKGDSPYSTLNYRVIKITQGEKITYINYDGTILGNESNVLHQEDYIFSFKRDGKTHIYLENGKYLGWTTLSDIHAMMDVEIARFEKDEITKYFEDKWQGDRELKVYTLKNIKSGKKTEEIYHQALRIDKNRTFGVTPTSVQILDDSLNVLTEKKMNYYKKYFLDGDVIIGENEDGFGNKYYIFLDKDLNILWTENRALMDKNEFTHKDYASPKYKEFFMIHSLQRIANQVFLEDGYEKVEEYIQDNILNNVLKTSKPFFSPREEGDMRWHSYNGTFIKEVGDIVIIKKASAGYVHGGGNFSGGETEMIYITKEGEELDKNTLLLEGWEIKAEELFNIWLKKNHFDSKEFDSDNFEFVLGEEVITFKKKSYYSGIADYMMEIELSPEDMINLIDTQSEIYKLAYEHNK